MGNTETENYGHVTGTIWPVSPEIDYILEPQSSAVRWGPWRKKNKKKNIPAASQTDELFEKGAYDCPQM